MTDILMNQWKKTDPHQHHLLNSGCVFPESVQRFLPDASLNPSLWQRGRGTVLHYNHTAPTTRYDAAGGERAREDESQLGVLTWMWKINSTVISNYYPGTDGKNR